MPQKRPRRPSPRKANAPVPPPGVAAAALQGSRAANDERLRASQRRNYVEAEQHAAKALELRHAAHTADPDHLDAEWQNDTSSHEDIVSFLTRYPDIP